MSLAKMFLPYGAKYISAAGLEQDVLNVLGIYESINFKIVSGKLDWTTKDYSFFWGRYKIVFVRSASGHLVTVGTFRKFDNRVKVQLCHTDRFGGWCAMGKLMGWVADGR